MRLPGSLLRVAGAFLVAGVAASPALAVPRYERIRAPARVKLDDRQQTATGRAAVRIANRGSAPAVFADAAALTAAVRLTADALKGPIICAPVGIAPAVAQRRFPLTVRPGQSRALRYDLTFTCGANPDRKPDWAFSVTVDHVALDGNADENPTNDTCPRAPTASDRGCGVAGPGYTRLAPMSDVRDARAGTHFELPGPYGVGETSLVLVDAARPTMPNGSFPGAPDRTLPTAVWYPTAPDTSGPDATLASNGRPFRSSSSGTPSAATTASRRSSPPTWRATATSWPPQTSRSPTSTRRAGRRSPTSPHKRAM